MPQGVGDHPQWTPIAQSCPILGIPPAGPVVTIDGLPFAPTWFGDSFASGGLPFHVPESPPRWAQLDEHVDVAIIGGGLSGLATAHRFAIATGCSLICARASAEMRWARVKSISLSSLGSAYFMVPDKGSDFDRLYDSLGVYAQAKIDATSCFHFEFGGELRRHLPKLHFRRICRAQETRGAAVQEYANNNYPDIPWTDAATRELVRQLDTQTFHESVDATCGVPGTVNV